VEKPREITSFGIAGAAAGIRTKYVRSMNLESYRYANLLGSVVSNPGEAAKRKRPSVFPLLIIIPPLLHSSHDYHDIVTVSAFQMTWSSSV
jgi:hypothetical protein